MSNSTLDRIRQKYDAMKQQSEKQSTTGNNSNLKWKPSPGKQVIRLLPYKWNDDPDYPFLELSFYYKDTFGKTWLSPTSVGKHDPVIEYAQSLTTGRLPKDEWTTARDLQRKLEPKKSYNAPILVRGQESDGVKFWTFNKTVFKELLDIMMNDDYGLISDLEKGTDITVTFTPNEDPKKSTVSIQPKRDTSPATEDREVLNAIKNMPNIIENFTVPTSDQLTAALKEYLLVSPSEGNEPKSAPAVSEKPKVVNQTNESSPALDMNSIMDEFDKLLG